MAGSINPGYNLNAATVPVSKYISNAAHVGVAQQTGKEAAQVKTEPAVEAQAAVTAPPQAAPEAAEPSLPGVHQQPQAGGGVEIWTDSGVSVKTDEQGQLTSISLGEEGTITPQEGGKLALLTPEGASYPVEAFNNEQGELQGYYYTRGDKTQVHVNLDSLTVAYASPHGDVWQEVDSTGGQLILTKSAYKDPKGGPLQELRSMIYVSPEGEVQVEGYNKDLKITEGKIEFRNPSNFPTSIELPNKISALRQPEPEAQPQTGPAPEKPSVSNGPLLMEDPVLTQTSTEPSPPAGEQPPPKPPVHVGLPSFTVFSRDEQGQTGIQLRSGLTLLHTRDRTIVTDPKTGQKLPVQVDNYRAADGRVEKVFSFADSAGNQYKMFNESMDFLVTSPDGKVRQHVLPDGTILGQIDADQGSYRFEVTPRGQYKTDPGLAMQPLIGQDLGNAVVAGPNGQPLPVNLPYPIPSDQSSAGLKGDIEGVPVFPQSGEKLPAFAGGGAPPPPPPQPAPLPPQASPLPPQPAQPPAGNVPPPPPPPGFAEPGMAGPTPPFSGGYYMPQPGVYQQPLEGPGMLQRLKYLFTGNPMDLQPKGIQPPPPWSGGYPNSYYGVPGSSFYPDSYASVPGYGFAPGSYGFNPAGAPPQGYVQQGQPWGTNPAAFGSPAGATGPIYGPPPQGGVPSYPGQQAPRPGFTGQVPGYPGQMPDANAYLAMMQQRFAMQDAMMWGSLAATNAGTNMMAMGQMFNSAMTGLNFGMALMPSSYFCNPFMFRRFF